MVQAMFSQDSKFLYTILRSFISIMWVKIPEHQHLMLGVQRFAFIFDVISLGSDYKDFYDTMNARKIISRDKWHNDPVVRTILAVCFSACTAAGAVFILNRALKPPIDLSKLVTGFDPNMPIDWIVPTFQKIAQWVLLNRAVMNITLGIVSSKGQTFWSGIGQFLAAGNISKLRWIRVEKSVENFLLVAPMNGTVKARVFFDFFVPSCKIAQNHFQESVQTIYDYVKTSFDKTAWHLFFAKSFLGKLYPSSVTAYIVIPSMSECMCKIKPILERVTSMATFNDKSIFSRIVMCSKGL